MRFERLLWLVPILFMFHNLEEAPLMEGWIKRLPLKIHPRVSTSQFVVAVTFLTLGGYLLTYVGLYWLPQAAGYLIILEMQAILLVNSVFPHIAATIHFRMYSPGFVTAVLFTLPFSVYLFQRAFAEQILNWAQFWTLMGIAPFAMVILALLSLQIGKILTEALPFWRGAK